MRFYSFLLLGLLLGAALVHARDEETADEDEAEQGVDEGEEEQSTTKPPKRVTKKPKRKDPEQPECRTETISGRPAYMCEPEVDGEKQKFGITFRDDGIQCGQYLNGQLNGQGSMMFLRGELPPQLVCGHFVDDKVNGSVSWYFFRAKNIELGGKTEYGQQGTSIVFYDTYKSLLRDWYKNGICQSRIRYDENGEENYRNTYDCS